MHYDIIIIGVGSMGSATAYYLAKQGVKVIGIEQYGIGHEHGSHTGQSRLIRKAYFEHPDYVPLLHRAYENWRYIESTSSTKLYYETGIAYFGYKGSEITGGSRRSASLYNIPLEDREPSAYAQKLSFSVPGDFESFFEPEAGFLLPEKAIRSYVEEARKLGATILTNTIVKNWEHQADGVIVETTAGTFKSQKVIITAGAWTSKLSTILKPKLKVTRQLLAWAEVEDSRRFLLGEFPCWFVDDREYGLFYGFPVLPESIGGPAGLKIAHHYPGERTTPEEVDQTPSWKDEGAIRYALETYLPRIKYKGLAFKHCLYTYSPDENFIIDFLPGCDQRVVIACGFSGHGFKFASVVGEILADLGTKGRTPLPIDFLRIERLQKN